MRPTTLILTPAITMLINRGTRLIRRISHVHDQTGIYPAVRYPSSSLVLTSLPLAWRKFKLILPARQTN
nr:hypothetical protein [Paenibacillus aceti]